MIFPDTSSALCERTRTKAECPIAKSGRAYVKPSTDGVMPKLSTHCLALALILQDGMSLTHHRLTCSSEKAYRTTTCDRRVQLTVWRRHLQSTVCSH